MKMSGNKTVVLAAALFLGVVVSTPNANSQATQETTSHPPAAAPMPLKPGSPPPGLPPSPPSAPAPFPQKTLVAPVAAATMDVKYDKGLLSVKAQKADLVELLKKIALAVALPIDVGQGISATVTVEFAGLGLEDGLSRILAAAGEKNLAIQYAKIPGRKKDEYKIDKIAVLRKADPKVIQEKDKEVLAGVRKRDQEYRDLFEKMDKDRNKIARTLKEFSDPHTSKDEKIKLRTYLRQMSINKPEDKKLLQGAALDPEYAPLRDDIQMALLHAIQEKPEDSDKEFILDLLRNKIPPGWLMYAMLKAWDERYIPFLLDYAKRNDYVAIEILGRMKVHEAVPVLEQIIRDEKVDRSVRGSALDSLWLITGKRYQVEK